MKKLVSVTTLLLPLLLSISSHGQSTAKPKSISPPDWVRAIDDPNANYYTAIKQYDAYWKTHTKPADEEELMHRGTDEVKKHLKKMTKREVREQNEQTYYRYQCKRFENWVHENKAYVQKDGRILTPDERLKLWQQSQKERQ